MCTGLEGQKERGSEGGKGGKEVWKGGLEHSMRWAGVSQSVPYLCSIPTVGRARGGMCYT